ncbi:unnamed protein product, partial [Nesidiocoris tenuis]
MECSRLNISPTTDITTSTSTYSGDKPLHSLEPDDSPKPQSPPIESPSTPTMISNSLEYPTPPIPGNPAPTTPIVQTPFGITFRQRRYGDNHQGPFIIILDAIGDDSPDERKLISLLGNFEEEDSVTVKKIGRKRFLISTTDETIYETIT